MRKLTRYPRGQISCSSDPEIRKDLDRVLIELRDVTIFAEPLDQAHMFNAWLWGIARLPDEQRRALTEVFVEDLERWRKDESMLGGQELLSAVRQALVEIKGTRVADVPLGDPDREHKSPRKRAGKPSGRA